MCCNLPRDYRFQQHVGTFLAINMMHIFVSGRRGIWQITPQSAWGLTQTPDNNLQNFKADLCRHHIKSVKAGGR